MSMIFTGTLICRHDHRPWQVQKIQCNLFIVFSGNYFTDKKIEEHLANLYCFVKSHPYEILCEERKT